MEQTRNKEQTRQKLIDATLELLRTNGFGSLGVNAIAEQAKVNKALIYRYFDGLDGLMCEAAKALDLTQTSIIDFSQLKNQEKPELKSFLTEGFLAIHEQLRNDQFAQNLMIQELSEENEITRAFAQAREQQGLKATEQVKTMFSEVRKNTESQSLDFEAIFAIFSAAITYLTLRSSTVQMFNGVDIQSKEGWIRLSSTLALLLEKALPKEP